MRPGNRLRAAALMVALALATTGCTGSNSSPSVSTSPFRLPVSDSDASVASSGAADSVTAVAPLPAGMSSAGSVSTGINKITANGVTAILKGGGELSAQPVTLSPAAQSQLALYSHSYGATFDAPVQIAADPAAASRGLTVSQILATAAPAQDRAFLAFWDDGLSGWRAVPTAVSADRKTLTATVKQSGVLTTAVVPVGNWLSRSGGTVFATRVAPPVCSGPVPAWVHTHSFVADPNSAVLWCVGRDTKNPKLLAVKVRANRGYGVVVTSKAAPDASTNDYVSGNALTLNTNLAAELGPTAAASLRHMLAGGQIVPGGREVDLTFSEIQVRTAGSTTKPLVTALSPTGLTLDTSLMLPLINTMGGTDTGGTDKGSAAGYVAALFAAANCGRVLTAVTGAGAGGRSVATCLSALGSQPPAELAQTLARSKLDGQKTPDALTREVAADLLNVQRLAASGVGFSLADQATTLKFTGPTGQVLIAPVTEVLLGKHAVGRLRLGTTVAGAQKLFPDLKLSTTSTGCRKATDRRLTLYFAAASDPDSAGRLVFVALGTGIEYQAVGFAPGDPLSKAKAAYGAATAGPGATLTFKTGAGSAVYLITTAGRTKNAKGVALPPFSAAEYAKQTVTSIALAGQGQTCAS